MNIPMNSKKNINHYSDRIEKEGIVVIDDITEMPIYGKPYISKNYVFGINHSGVVEAEYNMHAIEYHPQDISIVYPNHVIWAKRCSEDYRTTLVVVSAQSCRDLSNNATFNNRFRYELNPSFHLTDSQYVDIMNIIGAMRAVGKSDIPSRYTMMVSLLEVLLDMTDYFRHLNATEDDLAPQRISARFYQAVIEHHRQQHSVGFYADKFCLSPKYFSDVIKKETGYSAKYWISNYLIKEAKLLLRSRRDLNIQQISELLGYDDQTSFSRHFKKSTGMTPKDYRNSKEA